MRIAGQNLGQQHPARRRYHTLADFIALFIHGLIDRFDAGMQADRLGFHRMFDFSQSRIRRHAVGFRLPVRDHLERLLRIGFFDDIAGVIGFPQHDVFPLQRRRQSLDAIDMNDRAWRIRPLMGDIVQTQNDILRRHNNRLTIRRRQDVVGGHHQHAGFQLGFQRQRHVNGHLVPVKVRVKRRADQRVQLNGLPFDQLGFERLDTQTVQGRRTVQEDRMFADNFFQDIPDFGAFLFNQTLSRLDGRCHAIGFKLGIDKRFEQFQRHLFGQTALMQHQFRTHHDDRTAGIVDALAQQVLAETTLLAFEHIAQGFQRALVCTGDDTTTTAIIEQRIHGFLQHTLFIAHDDIGRTQFHQATQTVVPVDHAAIQIVQIRRCETATIQRHQRAQFRRDDRNNVQDHPFGARTRGQEGFQQFQTLHQLLAFCFRTGFGDVFAGLLDRFFRIDLRQHGFQCFRPDFRRECVFAIFVLGIQIFFF